MDMEIDTSRNFIEVIGGEIKIEDSRSFRCIKNVMSSNLRGDRSSNVSSKKRNKI